MSQSTNGQLCYGILFPEGFEFPWDDLKYGNDDSLKTWWREVNGFKHAKEVFDSDGNYIDGMTDDAYFMEGHDFDKSHPLPVELINYCSGDCPMFILAVPSTVIISRRGYPEVVSLKVWPQIDFEALADFLKNHSLDNGDGNKCQWYLSSYWG